jgi:TrmH family RNA methyltransferase
MIASIHNKRVARAARLKKRAMRERDRRFLVEGVQGVIEALSSSAPVDEVFVSPTGDRLDEVTRLAQRAAVPVRGVSAEVMAHLTSTVTPQGVVAVAGFVDVALSQIAAGGGCIPILVEVRDPGNAGTILRSADASGADAVVFTTASVDVYNQKTVRATAGSLFHVPIVREAGTEETVHILREQGYAVFAAGAGGRCSLYDVDLSGPTAVMFGNEARGLPSQVAALADDTLRIPIRGRAESLNLAAAATLVMFEAGRRTSGDPLAEVVAGAAHDIRSPLTALKGFSGLLLSRWDRLTEDERLTMLAGMAKDASRMEITVAHLVDAARIASNRLGLALEPTDLLETARKVGAEVRGWGPVDVDVDVSGEGARAEVDPARLREILVALIEGARWWGESGPVRVRVSDRPVPTISVSRARPTLDSASGASLFEPRSPGTGGGSKVGLFVARGLTEAHGGTIEVRTDDSVTFTATFPRRLRRPSPGT